MKNKIIEKNNKANFLKHLRDHNNMVKDVWKVTRYYKKLDEDTIKTLDPKIRDIVKILNDEGIETYESCQSGKGHCYPEPTVRFFGQANEGWRALAIALQYGLKVTALKRVYEIIEREPVGPNWEMTFILK